MNNKSINSNKQFMIGNGILASVDSLSYAFLYLAFATSLRVMTRKKHLPEFIQ